MRISKFEDDREGEFHTQVFERYNRYEPEVAEALTQMFVSGTSTHKVGKVAEKLMGTAPSASAVSRLNQTLTEQYEAWRERNLQNHYRVVYLDGIHMSAIPKREQQEVTTELTGIWKQEKKEDALLNLAASTRQISEALSPSHPQSL